MKSRHCRSGFSNFQLVLFERASPCAERSFFRSQRDFAVIVLILIIQGRYDVSCSARFPAEEMWRKSTRVRETSPSHSDVLPSRVFTVRRKKTETRPPRALRKHSFFPILRQKERDSIPSGSEPRRWSSYVIRSDEWHCWRSWQSVMTEELYEYSCISSLETGLITSRLADTSSICE